MIVLLCLRFKPCISHTRPDKFGARAQKAQERLAAFWKEAQPMLIFPKFVAYGSSHPGVGLTFELSGRRRLGAWPARPMIDMQGLAGQVPGRWCSALERGVRRHP